MFYIPIFGAVLEGAGSVIDKKILKNPKINFRNYVTYGFLGLVIVMLPLVYFFWNVKPEALQFNNLIIFALVIISSVFANILMCYALKRENITSIEPIRLMQPLFTILIALIFSFFFLSYAGERKFSIVVLALIASIALIASHVKKHHIKFDKYIIAAIAGSFFFAFELAVSKSILQYYNPLIFYFIRCLFVFLITLFIFKPKPSSIPKKTYLPILLVSAIWVIYRVILYYSYGINGVILTTMLLTILAPIFIYIFARIFLKEKITKRNIISAIIILICVIIAAILQK